MMPHSMTFRGLFAVSLLLLTNESSGQDLTVEVRSHAKTVILGEPVIVTATVVNNQANAVAIIHHNAPVLRKGLSIVDLKLGTTRENLRRWDARFGVDRRTQPTRLAPGERRTVDLVMLFSSKDGFFAFQPGTYWIQGRIVAEGVGELLSESVAVDIREPSAADKPMWEWLQAHQEEYGRLVQVPWEATLSEEFLKGCEDACTQAPSCYSEYLAYFLSRWYSEGPGKNRPDAKAQSARLAEIAKARATSDMLRAEAEGVLARLKARTPHQEKSDTAMDGD